MSGVITEFRGVLRLPSQIMLAEDALGRTYDVQAGATAFTISTPRLPDDIDQTPIGTARSLVRPRRRDARLRLVEKDRGWGHMAFAGEDRSGARIFASYVTTLLIHVTLDVDPKTESYPGAAEGLGDVLVPWWSRVMTWIELWTGQILTPESGPDVGLTSSIWTVAYDHPRRMLTGFANPSFVTLQPHTMAISGDDLQAAFDRAGGDETPPPEWELYLRSGRRSDLRLRIIDVATAVEVALSRALDRRLSAQPKAARDRITTMANGVVGLIDLLESIDGTEHPRRNLVMNRIAGPRNRAAHRGITPTPDEVTKASSTARILLDEYSPVPTPGRGS
jgi:hypothetical protein